MKNQIKPLSDFNMGYIAGIIDGDGSLVFGKKKRNNFRGFSWSVSLEVTMVNSVVGSYLKEITGLGCFSGPYTKKSTPTKDRSNEKPIYKYYVQSNDVVQLIDVVEPYVILKKKQCAFLKEAQGLLSDLYRVRIPRDRHDARLEEIYQEMKQLNKRGV